MATDLDSVSTGERSFPLDTTHLAAARQFALDAAGPSVEPQLASSIELVVSELASNAIDAGQGDDFVVRLTVHAGEIAIAVTNGIGDDDVLPDAGDWSADKALAARGRGLGIVDHIASRVEVERSGQSITVTAYLALGD